MVSEVTSISEGTAIFAETPKSEGTAISEGTPYLREQLYLSEQLYQRERLSISKYLKPSLPGCPVRLKIEQSSARKARTSVTLKTSRSFLIVTN